EFQKSEGGWRRSYLIQSNVLYWYNFKRGVSLEKRGRPRKKPDIHSQGPEVLRLLRKGNGSPSALNAEQMLLFKA
ncbi:MAG: hypothetical protein ACK5NG_10440, partial [Chthoniobacterales bacterium]